MSELFTSPFFGISLSILTFMVGVKLQKKTGLTACNPLLIAIILTIAVLLIFKIPYESYNVGGAAEKELAAHCGWLHSRFSDLHDKHLPALSAFPSG